MDSLSCASRGTPQAAGSLNRPDKLFSISPKTDSFLEPLANPCVNRLPMLYYECRRLNGLGSPFGMETWSHLSHHLSLRDGLNGLGSPFGMETQAASMPGKCINCWLNGLG